MQACRASFRKLPITAICTPITWRSIQLLNYPARWGFILRHWCVLPSILGSAGSANFSGCIGRICAVNHFGYGTRLDHIDNVASEDVLAAISDSAVRSATSLMENLDRKALAEAVDLIATADTVWLAGTGRTVAVKDYFQYLLTGVGIVSHVLDTSVEQIPADQVDG